MSSLSANELRDALAAFLDASRTRDAGRIGAALNRVLECEARLPAEAPERLRHFLQRRSYQKALEFLNQASSTASGNTIPSAPASTTGRSRDVRPGS